jgi:hypothetical protein
MIHSMAITLGITLSGLPALPHKRGRKPVALSLPHLSTAVRRVKSLPLVGRGWGGVFAPNATAIFIS